MTDAYEDIRNIMALAERLKGRVWWLPGAIHWELSKLQGIADKAPPGSDTINIAPIMAGIQRQLTRAMCELHQGNKDLPQELRDRLQQVLADHERAPWGTQDDIDAANASLDDVREPLLDALKTVRQSRELRDAMSKMTGARR